MWTTHTLSVINCNLNVFVSMSVAPSMWWTTASLEINLFSGEDSNSWQPSQGGRSCLPPRDQQSGGGPGHQPIHPGLGHRPGHPAKVAWPSKQGEKFFSNESHYYALIHSWLQWELIEKMHNHSDNTFLIVDSWECWKIKNLEIFTEIKKVIELENLFHSTLIVSNGALVLK